MPEITLIAGPLAIGTVLAIFVYAQAKVRGETTELRAKLSSEKIANRQLVSRIRRLEGAVTTYQGVNENLQTQNYELQRKLHTEQNRLAHAHLRDPVSGRLLKMGEKP